MADRITPKELQETKDEYIVVDVREADELDEGKIGGAINIPLGKLIREARHGDLNDLKTKKICTYCSGGYRGDAVTIEGGYSAYKNERNKKEKDSSSNSNE